MRATTDDRLRSAVLWGAAVAVLVAGGGWWHAAAPAPTAVPAGPPTAAPSEPTPLDRALVTSIEPGERLTVRLDDSGDIVSVPRGFWAEIDAATGVVTGVEGNPGRIFFRDGLPAFRETVWRERAALAPGERMVRQSAEGAARLLLQYRCTRPGSLTVTVVGAGLAGPSEIDCDGTVANARVLSHGRPFRVALSATGEREVDVEAQLVELPR
ncbi:hypothetical protein AB0C42_23920 [Micromonospora taraxaci]|uniref:hypothetical protein n=1 Tax=Micromonospora taraxaci TaxID=1316803 RepID=UPI0033D3D131